MLTVRLLVVLFFFSLCTASIRAQLSQQDNPGMVQRWNAESNDFSDSSADNPHRPTADLQSESASLQDHALTDHYHLQQHVPHIFVAPTEESTQADAICYSMRNYLVVRDGPHSDATHPGGYSTCQPATRFRVHSIQDQTQPLAP